MANHAILTAEAHGDLRIRTDRGAALGDAVMCCVTSPDEFRRVQNEYPILFRRDLERGAFTAFAMFGFETGENLFLDGDRWDARYRPLAMAIQPFLIGRGAGDHDPAQVHLDLDSPRIAGPGDEGVRLFDEHRRPSPYLDRIAEQLGELDSGWRGAADFFAALERHHLLEPFTLEVTLDDGAERSLVGWHIIDEDRLAELDAAALGELHAAGHLVPMFMAFASLSNLAGLVARKNRRQAGG